MAPVQNETAAVRHLGGTVTMNRMVGVWVDRTKAVVVSASAGHVTTKTLDSGTGLQTHCGQQLDWFYDQIISMMGQPEAMVIFGPDAKVGSCYGLGRRVGRPSRKP
jgi:ribosomal protein S2